MKVVHQVVNVRNQPVAVLLVYQTMPGQELFAGRLWLVIQAVLETINAPELLKMAVLLVWLVHVKSLQLAMFHVPVAFSVAQPKMVVLNVRLI